MIKGQKIELKVNSYKRWVERQNIPVIKEYYIQDLKTVPVSEWTFKGAKGVVYVLPESKAMQAFFPKYHDVG